MVIFSTFIFLFMILSNYFKWFTPADLSNIIMPIIIVGLMIFIFIPMMAAVMILDSDRTNEEYEILGRINSILESKYYVYDRLISPETPFTNERHYIETIQSCRNNIYLVDKWFNEAGLRLLNDGLKGKTDVSDVKIITSFDKATEDFRKSVIRLKDELQKRNIELSIKICDKELVDVHDRFLMTEGNTFLVPSPDIVKRGQYAQITGVSQRIPFQKYWDKGIDIIEGWNEICAFKKENKLI